MTDTLFKVDVSTAEVTHHHDGVLRPSLLPPNRRSLLKTVRYPSKAPEYTSFSFRQGLTQNRHEITEQEYCPVERNEFMVRITCQKLVRFN